MFNRKNNERVGMTRRYPNLKKKQIKRDSKIAQKLLVAWDHRQDADQVFEVFDRHNEKLSDQRYWELLRSVWVISGSVERQDKFIEWFHSSRGHSHFFSTPEEHERLRELPEEFIVYRAENIDGPEGIAWTLDEKYAEQYKVLFSKDKIIQKTVQKEEVFAVIERNMEEEVLIL